MNTNMEFFAGYDENMILQTITVSAIEAKLKGTSTLKLARFYLSQHYPKIQDVHKLSWGAYCERNRMDPSTGEGKRPAGRL